MRRSAFKIMFELLKKLRSLGWIMLLTIASGTLGFVCSTSIPVLGAVAAAKFAGAGVGLSYGAIFAMLAAAGVLRAALRYAEHYTGHYIAFKLLALLRDAVFKKLRELSPAKLEGRDKGNLIAMVTADIETLEVFYAHTIAPIAIAINMGVAMTVFIWLIGGWQLSVAALIAYAVIGGVLPVVSSRLMRERGERYRRDFADGNSQMLESIRGVNEMIMLSAVHTRRDGLARTTDNIEASTKALKDRAAFIRSFTEMLLYIFTFAAAGIAAAMYFSGQTQLLGLLICPVAIFSSFGPFLALSALPANLTQTFASGDRLLNLLDERPQVYDVTDGKSLDFDSLDVRSLSFAYGSQPVLRDVSFSLKQGEILGIMGKSGSGKSTLLKLLMRFWDVDSGEINYNGVPVKEIATNSLRANIAYVTQDTHLFDDTLLENLRIAKPDATEEEVAAACKKASLDEFIQGLPNGYQTRAGELGANLSAGERQRIGLARAFLCGAKLLLLDEPTSNVDSINEGIILSSLLREREDRTIILVSHRSSTLSICTRVLNLQSGVLKD